MQHIDNRVKSAQKHYEVTYKTFKTNATHFYNSIINNKKLMIILNQANSNDINIKNKARKKLASIFNMKYQLVAKLGIDLIHFHLPNNESFFRRFAQNSYGDDLTSLRYSVNQTNLNKKMYEGLEVGKYGHAFRFVFPLWITIL
ncbi:MAG: cache domain-containing protein [Campylobacterota bacterium]|nr:cache domain-containing protein [Campylobacterota bacterium]